MKRDGDLILVTFRCIFDVIKCSRHIDRVKLGGSWVGNQHEKCSKEKKLALLEAAVAIATMTEVFRKGNNSLSLCYLKLTSY